VRKACDKLFYPAKSQVDYICALWNLIGYSSNEANLSLSNAVFTNSSGSSYTWAQGILLKAYEIT